MGVGGRAIGAAPEKPGEIRGIVRCFRQTHEGTTAGFRRMLEENPVGVLADVASFVIDAGGGGCDASHG
jgi:hypothetical protein